MERNKIYSPLTDKELIEKAYWWIEQLIKSGGKDFVMHVPAQLDHDTDLVFFNLAKRFENLLGKYETLQARCNKYEKALRQAKKTVEWVKENMKGDYFNVLNDELVRINEALSGEGKEVELCTMCNAKPKGEQLTVCNDCYGSFDGDRRCFWTSDVYH